MNAMGWAADPLRLDSYTIHLYSGQTKNYKYYQTLEITLKYTIGDLYGFNHAVTTLKTHFVGSNILQVGSAAVQGFFYSKNGKLNMYFER